MEQKIKDAELLKSALAMGSVKLVENPELITVRTISPKLVDQMQFFDTADYTAEKCVREWWTFEIIGVVEKSYAIVVRDEDKKLGKIRPLNFIQYHRAEGKMNLEAAQGVFRALPQLFEV